VTWPEHASVSPWRLKAINPEMEENHMALTAQFAVWGALANGDPNHAQAADVAGKLQQLFNEGVTTLIVNDDNFGDPAYGFTKHFAATVNNNGRVSHYACQENQTINFEHPSS
jgi:hypothetical protein